MKPSDVRDSVWSKGRDKFRADLVKVWEVLQRHGPGTTRELAARSGLSLLTIRPRICELCKEYLATLVEKRGTEGVYRARSWEEAERTYREAVALANAKQIDLPFKEAV
jgi:predicted HTH transcriptional regulator